MAPKKRARTGQGANAASGVAVNPLFGDAAPAFGSDISDGDLRGAIQKLTQIVASQAQRSNVAPISSSQKGDSSGSRVNRFLQLDPLAFTGANPSEDPQDFIDKMHKTLQIMRSTKTEVVELAAYRLKEARVRWFVQGLSPLAINEATIAAMNSGMNYGKLCSANRAQSAAGELFQAQSGQQGTPPCPRCGKMHLGICYMDLPICYGCGLMGHIQRKCRSSRQGTGRGTTQPSSFAAATSSAPPPTRGTPAPAGRGAARGGAHSSGGPIHFYAMSGCQSAQASPDVVTGIFTIQSHDVYALIDPGSTLSYVTPYVAMEFGI
ncbi:uncharacterized protein [Nicotiana tomentosiformis]|uniref:uncharacterized protein n=1 Tax=Nicotiana tomentosiformis TaxID=4098 RepID=UPI00388C90EE